MPESLLDYMSLKGVGRKINPNPVGLAIEQYGILNPPELNPDNEEELENFKRYGLLGVYNKKGERIGSDQDRVQNLSNWFGDSKVTDNQGLPLTVYHGARRADRIGGQFYKKRATSGPMPFFTDDKETASNYAKNKQDTSIQTSDEFSNYRSWVKYRPDKRETPQNIDKAWFRMPTEERVKLFQRLPHVINAEEDLDEYAVKSGYSQIYNLQGEEGVKKAKERLAKGEKYQYVPKATALRDWSWYLNQSRGNPIETAVELWLEGGVLYDSENEFVDILKEAGANTKNIYYDDPWAEKEGVFPVYLSIQNPLETNNIPEEVINVLEARSKRQPPYKQVGGDMWDKRDRDPKLWVKDLKEDLAKGKFNSHAWTSIPDWVTQELKKLGYDGIKDMGNKAGLEMDHNVWIPFEPNQIKSIYNRGEFDPKKKNILSQNQPKLMTSLLG